MKDTPFDDYIFKNYISKDELIKEKEYKKKENLKNVDINEFWNELTAKRKERGTELNLEDKENRKLWFVETSESIEMVEGIEEMGRQEIEKIIPDEVKDTALIEALIDEAFSSSVIEGAYSTRKRAHEMIMQKSDPKNNSEQMIYNNYEALMFTLENIDSKITHEFIFKIWDMLTKGTIDPEDHTGGYRNDEVVIQRKCQIVFEGPHHTAVHDMVDSLIDFINTDNDLNPIVKACIIHYYFVYIHPFFDGNGRIARALMNIYLIKNGYDFFKYFSISKILVDNKFRYYEAIKKCEDYYSDVTYFINFYTKLLVDTIVEIRKNYMIQFSKKLIFEKMDETGIILNERQEKALKHLLKRTKKYIDIKEYTKKYRVVQETARKDLQIMVDYGVLRKIKSGKKYIYSLNRLDDILESLGRF